MADACNIHVGEAIKQAVDHTTVTGCGKIGTVELAEKILQENRVDLVGMARAIFCDPELPNKALAGRDKEIVKCTWCKYCLTHCMMMDKPCVCIKWPGVKAAKGFVEEEDQ